MRVVVAHHLWSSVGGGQLVSAYAVRAFLEAGYEVSIVSTFGFNKDRYREWFGLDLRRVRVYTLVPRELPALGMYQRLWLHVPLRKAIKREKPDIIFIDNEFYRPILKLKDDIGFKIFEYIHFPFTALERRALNSSKASEGRGLPEYYVREVEAYHKKYGKGVWKYYFKLWLRLYRRFARDNPFEDADTVLANSRYTAKLIKALWGGDAVVLNPPVMVEDFERPGRKSFDERDDAVVMIGRIAPEKRVEYVIDAIAASDSKPVLRVVGGLIPSAMAYKEFLERRASEKGVRVEFYPNVPREKLVRVVTSSKVLVHATVGEHFGIAVVEGMAAGCPVIVHRSGGPFEDIINRGEFGMYFESVDDLAKAIDTLMKDPAVWIKYHRLSRRRARMFSGEEFIRRLIGIVEKRLA